MVRTDVRFGTDEDVGPETETLLESGMIGSPPSSSFQRPLRLLVQLAGIYCRQTCLVVQVGVSPRTFGESHYGFSLQRPWSDGQRREVGMRMTDPRVPVQRDGAKGVETLPSSPLRPRPPHLRRFVHTNRECHLVSVAVGRGDPHQRQ